MPELKKMLTLEALSAALPSWLKRSTKPEYNADEIDSTQTTNQFVTASDKDKWDAKGTYSKPQNGIPKTDLESAVQTSLGLADSALQSETDPTVPSWAKQTDPPTYTASDVGAIATTAKGANGGVAELDANGKVPSSQLPSYVDDVLEYSAKSAFPAMGETGKIYVDTSDNKTYRWGGTTYVEISASLALGDTSSTAYYGDKGKIAYEHSQVTSGNPHNVTKSDVGLGSVGNFKAVSTVASQGLSDQEKIDARANIGAGTSSLVIGTAATQAAAGNHTHGNITNAGALQTTDVAIANGDKLVVTDASNSNKVARTSVAFDGSTATKCLTQKGTFETFGTSNLTLGTTAGTAAEGNHTHTKSQITDFPTSMTPTSHTHGNIQNGGTLQTNDIAIASGDKLVVTDASNSNKIARTSISFDGSTVTQVLTKKGTWETFNNIGYVTKQINLSNDVTWTQSQSGMYFSSKVSIPELSRVLGVTICGFYNLKNTDVIMPRIFGDNNYNGISFFGNTGTFNSGANVDIQVFGIV